MPTEDVISRVPDLVSKLAELEAAAEDHKSKGEPVHISLLVDIMKTKMEIEQAESLNKGLIP